MLNEFIIQNRAEIIERCRSKVAARSAPPSTPEDLEQGVALFLDQLAEAMRPPSSTSPAIREGAARRGEEMLHLGFTVGQVVHHYGDICQAITELALDRKAAISTDDFRALNRCLDDSIADAVTAYSERREERVSARETERLAIFNHELRNLLLSATLSFEVLSTGRVGIGGANGAILERSLSGLVELVNRSLNDVRSSAAIQNRERIAIPRFIDEVEASAALEARARNVRFTVVCEQDDSVVDADRQILGAVVGNLLQNAFKFSRPEGLVTLRTSANADRVRIDIEDECGGLPPGDSRGLFRPFERRGTDRSGLGLGLAVSQRGVEASGGDLQVRDVPGVGCVFTVNLPRAGSESRVAENLT
jgi:signal transduction histidine kinase